MQDRVIYLITGSATTLKFTFENADGSTAVTTGFTFTNFRIRESAGGKSLLNITSGTLDSGTLTINLTSTNTSSLPAGKFVAQVAFQDSGANPIITDPFEVFVTQGII
jgi:hypothetical protein